MFDQSISRFLGLGPAPTIRLCLPHFDRAVAGSSEADAFVYPSNALAERDVRSAFHVQRLASEAGAEVRFISPDALARELDSTASGEATSVVFGSRSNPALGRVLGSTVLRHLMEFEFGSEWVIRLKDGSRYSLDDPSKLSRDAYAAKVDFGVVAGCTAAAGSAGSLFVVAGLGGRATEGCGIYLQREWRSLADRAGGRAFAAVLRFDPPINPETSVLANVVIH
ncbi:hypothetical protein [Methylobacterium oxalidis]|uniref:hypothetical protein n=1 Tax=Methylobacterium oxalidis TaxID=944322 RepID=UPI003314BE56